MDTLEHLFGIFSRADRELYLVGGAVRDMAMGHDFDSLDDLDFATNARPRETLALLQEAGYKTYDVGIEFGTVGTLVRGPRRRGYPKDVQITTYRSEEKYRRGSRHPVVSYGHSIDEDLRRRDFSINSIAMGANGEYYDPYDGRGDIARGVLRAVGDPLERLAEDPLRILRIARFMAKLGFDPDASLEAAARVKATWLLEIARQRWLQEMGKLLIGPHAPKALQFLSQTRALGVILPEVASLVDLHQRCPGGPLHEDYWSLTCQRVVRAGSDKIRSWTALLADIGRPWTRVLDPDGGQPGAELAGMASGAFPQEPVSGVKANFPHCAQMASLMSKGIARRFHFDNATSDEVSFTLAHHHLALAPGGAQWSDVEVRRFAQAVGAHADRVLDFAELLVDEPDTPEGAAPAAIRARLNALRERNELLPELPKGLGKLLIDELSVKPGPRLGELIDALKESIILGEVPFNLDGRSYLAHAAGLL